MSEDPEAGVLGHEVAVRDEEHKVSGRADTLTRTAAGTEVVEYKSIDSKAFHYSDLPYESHVAQVASYLAFPSEFGMADRARIGYIGKTEGRIEEFTVESTPELVEYVKSNFVRLEGLLTKYRETKELPPPLDVPAKDYRIRFCDYLGTGVCCGDRSQPLQPERASQVQSGAEGVLGGGLHEPGPDDARPVQAPRKRKKGSKVEPPTGVQIASGI